MNGNKKLFWNEVSRMKVEELQQNKGWKLEVGTVRGRSLRFFII